MSDVTVVGCKVCVINPRGKNSEYCNRGYSQATCADVGEAYTRGERNERKRIIAKLRAKVAEIGRTTLVNRDPYDCGRHDALEELANELEAECE